jgi:hypothetical protein
MIDKRAALQLAILRKNANEMQLPDLLRQSTGEVVEPEETEDPRMQQAKARLDEAKIAEQQKAELAREKLLIEEQRAENERLKLELEGHKLEKEKEDIAQEEEQRQAEAMAAQQQAEAQPPQPDNAIQQAALQQTMPKIAGAAPYYFGLPNIYSLKMFQSPLRSVTINTGDA